MLICIKNEPEHHFLTRTMSQHTDSTNLT